MGGRVWTGVVIDGKIGLGRWEEGKVVLYLYSCLYPSFGYIVRSFYLYEGTSTCTCTAPKF